MPAMSIESRRSITVWISEAGSEQNTVAPCDLATAAA
jgi:hypothetical protein